MKVKVVVVVEGGLVTGGALVPDCRRAGASANDAATDQFAGLGLRGE